MAEIDSINGIAAGSVTKINNVARASVDNIHGHTFPAGGTPTNYLNETFDGISEGYGQAPTNWVNNTGQTVYGSTTSNRKWDAEKGTTTSSTTAPSNAHGGSTTSGDFSNSSGVYMYTEASGVYNKDFLLRTPELDFSNSLNNGTLNLTFWFHMYATSTLSSHMGELMVGVSDSATSAADGSVGTGFSAAADDASSRTGMSIEFWDDASDDGSSTTTAIVIEGVQQTLGHTSTAQGAYWRKATVNLNAVAGESSVYIWFYGRTGSSYASDICIDSIRVDGEE